MLDVPVPTTKHMPGKVLWFTGLSGSGKSTLCHAVEVQLRKRNLSCRVLDGDDLRSTLSTDLGFSMKDRLESVRRAAHIARLFSQSDFTVLVALITPLDEARRLARSILPELIEVFLDAPLQVCETRDPKGLYRRARAGLISDFTGVDAPYHRPATADITCYTAQETIEQSTATIVRYLLGGEADHFVVNEDIAQSQRRRCIAVDFDGTLVNYNGWRGRNALGAVREDVVKALQRLRGEGWKIVIHTTRTPDDIVQHLVDAMVPFDDINRNSDYTNLGCKPVATVYWDDRALRYTGDAEKDIAEILHFRTWSGRL